MIAHRSHLFCKYAPLCVVLLFVVKAALNSVWVVRPWDVPDEVGHFSTIKGLASGTGIPVLHQTPIDEEVWRSFAPESASQPGVNWIAQHPPLYHLLMVPVYWMGSLLGASFWSSFYLIRIATTFIFGLGLWCLMKALRELGLPTGIVPGLGIMVASIPNHTYLAGAVNHDAMAFLFGGLVLLYWIRYTKTASKNDLVRLGLALGLGGLVKYTLLVLYPPIICLTLVSMMTGKRLSGRLVTQFLLLVMLPVGLWMLRNLLVIGEVLPVDTTGFRSAQPLEMSLVGFGREFPLFSIVLQSFWGLLGWMGDRTLQVRWLSMYSIYQQAFSWPLVLLLSLTLYHCFGEGMRDGKRLAFGVAGVIVLLLSTVLSGWLTKEYPFYLPLFVAGIVVIGWNLGELFFAMSRKSPDATRMVEIGSMGVFLFFLLVYYYKIHSFSVPSGALQGTFGRYFLPVVGFFIVGFLSRGLGNNRLASYLVMGSAMVYACTELYVWLHEAIPFFMVYE